jgi:hypothetical protein
VTHKSEQLRFAEWLELTLPVATWIASQLSNVRRRAYLGGEDKRKSRQTATENAGATPAAALFGPSLGTVNRAYRPQRTLCVTMEPSHSYWCGPITLEAPGQWGFNLQPRNRHAGIPVACQPSDCSLKQLSSGGWRSLEAPSGNPVPLLGNGFPRRWTTAFCKGGWLPPSLS